MLVLVGLGLLGPGAIAQTDEQAPTEEPATTVTSAVPGGDIIPRPNSGEAPEDAGDRGGALQGALFFIVVGAVLVVGALVVRSSRKARAERGF